MAEAGAAVGSQGSHGRTADPHRFRIAIFPCADGYFFIPTRGSRSAVSSYDLSGRSELTC
jgi:anaerobic C4-dicarboxylate transporter